MKYSLAGSNYPPARVEPHISRVERLFERDYLGTLYDKMIDDLIDHGDLDEYEIGATYALNDKVIYYGSVMVSMVADNTVNPCEDKNVNWNEVGKFTTACYESLWDNAKYYLANTAVAASLASTTYGLNSNGATRRYVENTGGSGRQSVGATEYRLVKDQMERAASEELSLLVDYMKNSTSCDYSEATILKKCGSQKQLPRKRRFHFKQKATSQTK